MSNSELGQGLNNTQIQNQGDTNDVSGDVWRQAPLGLRNINTGGGNYNERIERDYIQGNYYCKKRWDIVR
ncbi:hypothetical protein AMR41_19950 [Hapalosiphon sp. MRB220]|nr:hypothetical protein AMR41_19950 [Hapalosiphon sp. MRB220]